MKLNLKLKWRLEYIIIMALMVAYLLNFTLGIIELIPDNAPLIGNIDEFIASVLLLWSAEKVGIKIV